MKIIDLLNKMESNKNYKPTFLFKDCIYKYNAETTYYEPSFMGLYKIYMILDNEIEIIEEKPEKIEKIKTTTVYCGFDNEEENIKKLFKLVHFNENKINEVIDKLNYLLEKSDKEC